MPSMTVPTTSLENKSVPAGVYTFVVKGMKFKKAKSDPSSFNYKPELAIVNNASDPELNGKPIFIDISAKAGWIMQDFVHALGLDMVFVGADQSAMPGSINENGSPNDPEKWTYDGPIIGRQGTAQLIETSYQGKPQVKVNQLFCMLTGCKEGQLVDGAGKKREVKHSNNLAK